MARIKIMLILGYLSLLLSGCDKSTDEYELELNQKIYFQFEYMNYAWGYRHSGWLIDSAGDVYCYDKPQNWTHFDSTGIMSAPEMETNLLATDSVCFQIDKSELNEKASLINPASKGVVSDPVHEMYDAGSAGFYAFIYDAKTEIYRRIVLKQTGDFRVDNSSDEAVDLYEWLLSVNRMINGY